MPGLRRYPNGTNFAPGLSHFLTTCRELKVTMPPENMAASKLITPSENAGREIWRTRCEILVCMDPLARLRTVGDRLAPPTEALAQAIA
jgi:hypothetical protein